MRAMQDKVNTLTNKFNVKLIAYWGVWGFFLRTFLSSAFFFFFFSFFFKIILIIFNVSGKPSECQTVWTLLRPDDLSGLIWAQVISKTKLKRLCSRL